jgi:regulator of replication initiation timing
MIAIEYDAELSKLQQRIEELLERNHDLERRNQELEQENQRLRELLNAKGESKGSRKPKFRLKYSLEKNPVKRKRRHPSTGRRDQRQKLALVSDTEDIYPPIVQPEDCVPQREQYAWRIIEGRAEYVCYTIYDRPDSKTIPHVPGLRNSRSEYGLEIIVIVAFLHYWIGISLDHVCDVLRFFTGLELSKSQADSLLNQLSRDWAEQYDTIAELLALQLVIYIDETGWKVGERSCYTWAFSTAMHVLFRCGVGRGKAEAQAILGDKFGGIGVSDDYGAYKHLFEEHQLCWAHLLRKAIKLMLQYPDKQEYAVFLEELYAIYQQAVRWQRDQRLSVGRQEKSKQLQARILDLCTRAGETLENPKLSVDEATFIRLQNELVNDVASLFVFVEHPEVEPTNNRSERNVRREAEIRKGGRTSKSDHGAKRRSIIMTVLATLNTRFKKFTLENLLAEVARWLEIGRSTFQSELAGMHKANAPPVC